MKTYRDEPQDMAEFQQALEDKVFAFYFADTTRVPKPWYRKAWEIFGRDHNEHVVRLAMSYLESGFRRDKVVDSFRLAREHAFKTIAREKNPARDEGRGTGMAGAVRNLLNDPQHDRHTRAVFAFTRWNVNRKAGKSQEERARMDAEFGERMKDHNTPEFIDEWGAKVSG